MLSLLPLLIATVFGIIADMLGWGRRVAPVGGVLLLAGGSMGLWTAWTMTAQKAGEQFAVGGGFSAMGGLIAVLAASTLFVDDGESRIQVGQRVALVAMSALGAALSVHSTNLIVLALALETTAVCSYALVASARTTASAEASMKYFIQGAVATGFIILGFAVLVSRYSLDGSYGGLVGASSAADTGLLSGFILVVGALCVKAAVAPFHSWAPDAYQSAPASAAAVLAGPGKLAALGVLTVLVGMSATSGASAQYPLGLLGQDMLPIIAMLAVISILIGSLAAAQQSSLTRMLGYAGVAQAGYALIAIAAASPSTAILFSATYAVGSVAVFLSVALLRVVTPEWDGSVKGLAGTGRAHPVLALVFTVAVLSLAGIPPLLGFWGKFQVLQSAVVLAIGFGGQGSTGLAVMYWILTGVGAVGAIIAVGYYGSILRSLYSAGDESESVTARLGVVLSGPTVIAVLIVIFGLLPLVIEPTVLMRGFLL
jgi:NADH-quinone oxidoreductase subunit N